MKERPYLVLLNYNNFRYLQECLESVEKFHSLWKGVFFIDDCSTDQDFCQYRMLVSRYLSGKIQVLQNPKNMGVKESLQSFFASQRPAFFQLLATDDYFIEANVFEGKLDSNDVYLSPGNYVGINGEKLGSYSPALVAKYKTFISTVNQIYYTNPVKAPGLILHSSLALRAFQKSNVGFEDWPVLRQAVSELGSLRSLKGCLVGYRQHPESLTSKRNADREAWLQTHKLTFLTESKDFNISLYVRFMIQAQIWSLDNSSFFKRLLGRSLRFFDIYRWSVCLKF